MRTNANVAAQNIKFYKDIGGLLVCKGIHICFREDLKYILIKDSFVPILNVKCIGKPNEIVSKIRIHYGIAIVQNEDIKLYAFIFKTTLDFAREKNLLIKRKPL